MVSGSVAQSSNSTDVDIEVRVAPCTLTALFHPCELSCDRVVRNFGSLRWQEPEFVQGLAGKQGLFAHASLRL